MNRQEEITRLGLDRYINGVDIHAQIDSFINLNTLGLDRSLKLYHILKYEYLVNSLSQGCLFMKKTDDWEDIDDTFLFNTVFKDRDGSLTSLGSIKKDLYFQCWSKTEESEALWRAYSCDENFEMVKIKTSADKLMTSLYDINNPLHYESYFIGNVCYVDEKAIESAKCGFDINALLFSGEPLINSLFFKREKYRFENEVRLLFRATEPTCGGSSNIKNKWDINDKKFSFKIDINDVIEEIVLHPKLNDNDCVKMAEEIRTLGYKGTMRKSTLSI